MKKNVLLATVAVAALAAGSANAFTTGWSSGLMAGYSYNTAKFKKKDTTKDMVTKIAADNVAFAGNFHKETISGFNATAFVAHTFALGVQNYLDARLFVSYDTSNGKMFDVSHVAGAAKTTGDAKMKLAPKFGVGLGLFVGHDFTPTLSGYAGISGEFNFAKLKLTGDVTAGGVTYAFKHRDNIRMFSIAPTVGFKGKLNEKMDWLAEVSYKTAVNVSGFNKTLNVDVKTKPAAFIAKVGVSYHF